MFEGHSLSEKIDVYSFGILLWECFTGEVPWSDLDSPMQVNIFELICCIMIFIVMPLHQTHFSALSAQRSMLELSEDAMAITADLSCIWPGDCKLSHDLGIASIHAIQDSHISKSSSFC